LASFSAAAAAAPPFAFGLLFLLPPTAGAFGFALAASAFLAASAAPGAAAGAASV
jgi:hypothetical protein